MKISGFTIVRNAEKYGYPAVESIKSILPICDEFIVNVGDSDDNTLAMIQSIKDPKIKILQTQWDFASGEDVLSKQTNHALDACAGDWAFYLQSDEVIHEADLPRIKARLKKHLDDPAVDVWRFQWMHFYGSYFRYRIDSGWFQKQDRIIRNNGTIESCTDAYTFQRKDGKPVGRRPIRCLMYHYGWVQPPDVMTQRRVNAERIGFTKLTQDERQQGYDYGDLTRFPAYFGSHPAVMAQRVAVHALSIEDRQRIAAQYWWHPARLLRLRHKTSKRIKKKIV